MSINNNTIHATKNELRNRILLQSKLNKNIPWIEKYRPHKLDEILFQEESINILFNTSKTGELPHLLIYGPPGTGKTSSILALCNELYGPKRINERVIELNASDERGINVVRHKIINFAKIAIGTTDNKYLCPPYKIIILDEADAMTKEAQSALRKVMEETSNITRFCFICNYINQIIEPINSRCVKIRFKPIEDSFIITRLKIIAKNEKLHISLDAVESIAKISNGDFRKSILMLQNIKYLKDNIKDKIIKEDIYKMCKYITYDELLYYINILKDNTTNISMTNKLLSVTNEIVNKGYIFISIIHEMINFIMNNESINDKKKAIILFDLSNIEKNINDGANEYINILKIFDNIKAIL
jgi:replication factor C subunit 2/4